MLCDTFPASDRRPDHRPRTTGITMRRPRSMSVRRALPRRCDRPHEWPPEGGPLHSTVPAPSQPPPPIAARFILQKGRVTLQPNARLAVKTPMPLVDDTDPNGPTVVRAGTLSLQIIKRGDVAAGDRFGIRVRDMGSEARKAFKGL